MNASIVLATALPCAAAEGKVCHVIFDDAWQYQKDALVAAFDAKGYSTTYIHGGDSPSTTDAEAYYAAFSVGDFYLRDGSHSENYAGADSRCEAIDFELAEVTPTVSRDGASIGGRIGLKSVLPGRAAGPIAADGMCEDLVPAEIARRLSACPVAESVTHDDRSVERSL